MQGKVARDAGGGCRGALGYLQHREGMEGMQTRHAGDADSMELHGMDAGDGWEGCREAWGTESGCKGQKEGVAAGDAEHRGAPGGA